MPIYRHLSCVLAIAGMWPLAARCDGPVEVETPLIDIIFNAFAPAGNLVPADPFEAQIKQVVPHFVQSLRPLLASELAFIRQVCDIPKDRRAKIKAAGEAGLEKAALELAQQQFGGNRRGGMRARNSQPNPRKTVREALAVALKEALTPEQMARYTGEADKRTARRKRAAILTAIAQLDDALSLTGEQREKIFESISSNWQESWEQWLHLGSYGWQYFPTIPDVVVAGALNVEQKSVWNVLPKIDLGFSFGAIEQMPDDDGWWGNEPAKAADAAQVDQPLLFITQ